MSSALRRHRKRSRFYHVWASMLRAVLELGFAGTMALIVEWYQRLSYQDFGGIDTSLARNLSGRHEEDCRSDLGLEPWVFIIKWRSRDWDSSLPDDALCKVA
ncbi:hypothetical protein QBC43DRAFT_330931 [Cladorrhinum sp. PSN259]|nr:hypothetical protein QBC43DRAFT_330931 [Cladorrhinum sp. PSN259]